jgi:GMP reductase
MTKVSEDIKLDFKDVLIVPCNSSLKSRSDVSLLRTFKFKYYPHELTCIPIIASNMSTVGTVSMANELAKSQILTVLHKYVPEEDYVNVSKKFTFISCGISNKDLDYARRCITFHGFDKVCIDVANGYMEKALEIIQILRGEFPQILIMAGNVATPERSVEYINAGADITKNGIGSGSACLTRLKAGVGYPQLSCILDSQEHIHQVGGFMVSDGGCSSPADLCKAFGAGADFVMLGGMLGGHLESEGDIIEVNGHKKMLMYGMSSKTAQDKFNGGMNEYRSSEGRSFLLDYRGNVKETMNDILGGLRSCGTYIGCDRIEDFYESIRFIRVTQQLNNPYDSRGSAP